MQKMVLIASLALTILLVIIGPFLMEAAWYDGFYQFCLHAPAQPGRQQSPAMYFESECKQMLQDAKDMNLYHNLVIPTPTKPGIPQGY